MNKEEAIEHIKSNPEIYFKAAKKKGYVCPLCQNGTGRDGTGIEEIPENKGHFKCFKCNEGGDVLHFIGKEYGLTSFPEILEKAFSIYGITIEDGKYKKKEDKKEMQKTAEKQSIRLEEDYRDFYKKANENLNKDYELNKTNYLGSRGISIETQNRFNIGYVKDWVSPKAKREGKNPLPSPRVIIPTSDSSYVARDTSADIKEYKIVKEGKSHLFNLETLSKESDEPIFIVEGEIDALSVIEAGGEAIGLGGVGNINLLMNELEKKRKEARKHPFIICLDNDKSGEETSKKLQELLKTKGFAFEDKSKEMPRIMRPLAGNKERADRIEAYCKDPNEALVEKKEEFIAAIKDIKTQITKNFEKKLEEERENYIQEYVDKILAIAEDFFIEKKPIETGLPELDKFLDGGLYAELHILVAAPSAGKTTFALQIADNMAKAGQDVLFFSGEMTIKEMVAKSVSRLSKETSKDDSKDTLTMRTVLYVSNSNNSDYEDRVTTLTLDVYSKLAKHIRIYDGLQEIKDIENKIAEHKRITGNNPVVFIDYLQIIKNKAGSASDKRVQVDEIVSNLRIAAAKYGIPIFVIASSNREGYKKDKDDKEKKENSDTKLIGMANIKESGGIEYGADVLITLNTIEGQDRGYERGVMVRVLKNRTGQRHIATQHIEFKYHTRFNYFSDGKTVTKDPKETNKEDKKKRKKKQSDIQYDDGGAE